MEIIHINIYEWGGVYRGHRLGISIMWKDSKTNKKM